MALLPSNPKIVIQIVGPLAALFCLIGHAEHLEIPAKRESDGEAPYRRFKREPKQEFCDKTAGNQNLHQPEIHFLLVAMDAGEFKDLPGDVQGEKRSYTYMCTLGKGQSEAVVFRVKIRDSGKMVALKVAFKGPAKENLKKEAEMMIAAHAAHPDYVPKPGPHGKSKSNGRHNAYYYLEMEEAGLTLKSLLVTDTLIDPTGWKKYFVKTMDMVAAIHNKDLAKCFVHGDLHLENVALHKDNTDKLFLIDWGNSRRCTLPGKDAIETNIDGDSMTYAVLGDLSHLAEEIARCACTAASVMIRGKAETCGAGGKNAKAYAQTAAAKFVGLEAKYVKTSADCTWATLMKMQDELKGLVQDPK